ncbi:hypothetical protein AAG570_011400 [Ranatra chinensis]|uniref:Uncharacterized protein n=1 Tax=Ranatra chinensis TaxID=642074 RepID=A0ABD0YWR5_9HEMI
MHGSVKQDAVDSRSWQPCFVTNTVDWDSTTQKGIPPGLVNSSTPRSRLQSCSKDDGYESSSVREHGVREHDTNSGGGTTSAVGTANTTVEWSTDRGYVGGRWEGNLPGYRLGRRVTLTTLMGNFTGGGCAEGVAGLAYREAAQALPLPTVNRNTTGTTPGI